MTNLLRRGSLYPELYLRGYTLAQTKLRDPLTRREGISTRRIQNLRHLEEGSYQVVTF